MGFTDDYEDDDFPCDTCPDAEWCDHWEAQFCCTLCHWYGTEYCDDCNPMDI